MAGCQHADRDPVLHRAFLEALRGARARGEASPTHLACLEDRARVRAGPPQLYGIQFTVTGGEFGPDLIENPQRLDERSGGLEPFAIYEARMPPGLAGLDPIDENAPMPRLARALSPGEYIH